MADEAGEDGGQAIARSVQHNSGGGSLHCYLGAAALCRATGEKYSLNLFNHIYLILTSPPQCSTFRYRNYLKLYGL